MWISLANTKYFKIMKNEQTLWLRCKTGYKIQYSYFKVTVLTITDQVLKACSIWEVGQKIIIEISFLFPPDYKEYFFAPNRSSGCAFFGMDSVKPSGRRYLKTTISCSLVLYFRNHNRLNCKFFYVFFPVSPYSLWITRDSEKLFGFLHVFFT